MEQEFFSPEEIKAKLVKIIASGDIDKLKKSLAKYPQEDSFFEEEETIIAMHWLLTNLDGERDRDVIEYLLSLYKLNFDTLDEFIDKYILHLLASGDLDKINRAFKLNPEKKEELALTKENIERMEVGIITNLLHEKYDEARELFDFYPKKFGLEESTSIRDSVQNEFMKSISTRNGIRAAAIKALFPKFIEPIEEEIKKQLRYREEEEEKEEEEKEIVNKEENKKEFIKGEIIEEAEIIEGEVEEIIGEETKEEESTKEEVAKEEEKEEVVKEEEKEEVAKEEEKEEESTKEEEEK